MTTRENTVNAWQDYTAAKETCDAAQADPVAREAIRKATSRLHYGELAAATLPVSVIAFSILLNHGPLWILAVLVFIGQVIAIKNTTAAERTLQDAHDRENEAYSTFSNLLDAVADEARDLGFHVAAVNRNEKCIETSEGTITVAVDPETHTPHLFLDGRPIRSSYRFDTYNMTDLDGNPMNTTEDALVLP